MKKQDWERSLKRFLKKKITYSLSLLVAFMITGGISWTKEQEIEVPQIVEEEPVNIPTHSTQIFFNFDWLRTGKKKDRTDSEFKETIEASGRKDKVISGNGIVIDTSKNHEVIKPGAHPETELVARDEFLSIPVEIDPSIDIDVSIPNVSLGAIPNIDTPIFKKINIPPRPYIIKPNIPTKIDVTIDKPVVQIQKPTVDMVIHAPNEPPNKTVTVTSPVAPPGYTPTQVNIPSAPTTPTIVVPDIPSFVSNVESDGNDTVYAYDYPAGWNGVIQSVVVTDGDFHIERFLRHEKYDTGATTIEGDYTRWKYYYTGYDGVSPWGKARGWNDKGPLLTSWENLDRGTADSPITTVGGLHGGTRVMQQLGFQKVVGGINVSPNMLTNAKYIYTHKLENANSPLGEFAHLDLHIARARVNTYDSAIEGLDETTRLKVKAAYDDAGDNVNWTDKTTKDSLRHTWINSGKIILEGGNTTLTNSYDHHFDKENVSYNSPNAKSMAINVGEVIVQPYKDTDSEGTIYQKNTGVFVLSSEGKDGPKKGRDTYRETASHQIMYNSGDISTFTQVASMFLSGSANSLGKPLSIVNKGNLAMYGENSAGIYLMEGVATHYSSTEADPTKITEYEWGFTNNDLQFDNPLQLFGDSSIGLYQMDPRDTADIITTHKKVKPTTVGTTTGNFKVNIGALGEGNQTFTTTAGDTGGEILNNHNINSSKESPLIEGTYGIIAVGNVELTSHEINIYDQTKNSVGVYSIASGFSRADGGTPMGDPILNIGKGTISLTGGEYNVGVLAYSYVDSDNKDVIRGQGGVTSSGEIVLKGGTGNIGVLTKGQDTKQVTVDKVTASSWTKDDNTVDNTEGMIVLYGEDGGEIKVNELQADLTPGENPTDIKYDTGAVYAVGKNTVIDISRTSLPTTRADSPNIKVTGGQVAGTTTQIGFGLMAKDGATIEAPYNYIQVVNGSTGIGSIGKDENNKVSSVNFDHGILDFSGTGYALYSDGTGTISMKNGTLHLRDGATAYDIDLSKSSTLTLTDSKIIAHDPNVVVFTLKNVPTGTSLNTSSLASTIFGWVGSDEALIDIDASNKNYRVAALDGGKSDGTATNITLEDLDKTGYSLIEGTDAQKHGYFYYRRFLPQHLVASTPTEGTAEEKAVTISAVITDTDAKSYFNDQVVGLEMSSSVVEGLSSPSNTTTGIKILNGSQVLADRVYAGTDKTGAIGLFINYGQVEVDETSQILVEEAGEKVTIKGVEYDNTVQSQGVGIYAVNGSEVTVGTPEVSNDISNIKVGGNQAIGILGMAYREENENPKKDAFGDGKITVNNYGNIVMDGKGSVGIYGHNHSPDETQPPASNMKLNNEGTITIGDALFDGDTLVSSAIGIYGDNATISSTGKIDVGESGVGIYGVNGSNITALGTMTLGKNAIAVMADNTTTIAGGTSLTLISSTVDDTGKTGIYYKGTDDTKESSVTLDVDIDATGTLLTTDIYGDGVSVTSKGNLKVGGGDGDAAQKSKGGVGIAVLTSDTATYTNSAINEGDIILAGASSTGIYGKNAKIINNGTIRMDVDGVAGPTTSKVGLYGEGEKTTLTNNGTIEVNSRWSIGMFAKAGAKATLIGTTKRPTGGLVFGTSHDKAVGVSLVSKEGKYGYLSLYGPLVFKSKNNMENTLIFSQGGVTTFEEGSSLKVDGVVGATQNKTRTTAGMYLVGAKQAENVVNFNSRPMEVVNGAIGVYVKGGAKGNDTLNTLSMINVTADEQNNADLPTVGAFINGNVKIDGTVTAKDGAIGIYSGGYTVGINGKTYSNIKKIYMGENGLTLNMSGEKSVGMVLRDDAFVVDTDKTITITNDGKNKNVGVYYGRGMFADYLSSEVITHGAALQLNSSKTIGLYISGTSSEEGVTELLTLNDAKDITSGQADQVDVLEKNTGVHVYGKGTLNYSGNIDMYDKSGIGIFVEEGTANNSGAVAVHGSAGTTTSTETGVTTTTVTPSIGMVAQADAGKTATINNSGTITVDKENNIGMYVAGEGTTIATNTGKIDSAGIGIYLDGANTSFDNSGGTIDADQVAIYLRNTGSGTITAANMGTLNLTKDGAIGIYGENAYVEDQILNFSSSGFTGITGVVAEGGSGTTTISGNTIEVDGGSVALYVKDENVSLSGNKIITGDTILDPSGDPEKNKLAIGVYFGDEAEGTFTMDATNSVTAGESAIGIYMGDHMETTGTAFTLEHSGTVTTGKAGIGVAVTPRTEFISKDSTFNIDGGAGLYVDLGTATVGNYNGSGNKSTFNFEDLGGIGVIVNGGTLNIGKDMGFSSTATDIGSIIVVQNKNGNIDNQEDIPITLGGTAFLSAYEDIKSGDTSVRYIKNSGNITLTGGSSGIVAIRDTEGQAGDTPNSNVTITNTGTISASGINSTNKSHSVGIYTDIAKTVDNSKGILKVGEDGVGIFAEYNGVSADIDYGTIDITGSRATGIYLKGTGGELKGTSITSTDSGGTGALGIFLDGVKTTTRGTLDVGSIDLTKGASNIGFVARNGGTSSIKGSIKVGDGTLETNSLGVGIGPGTHLTITDETNVEVGDYGVAVYAYGEDGKEDETEIIVENASDIKAGDKGIAIYVKDGTVEVKSGKISADGHIGIMNLSGTVKLNQNELDVDNGGIGIYIQDEWDSNLTGEKNIIVKNSRYGMRDPEPGETPQYSIGIYLNNLTIPSEKIPHVVQEGNYVIGWVAENCVGYVPAFNLGKGEHTGGPYNHMVKVMSKRTDSTKQSALHLTGTINIDGGKNNIGVYGENTEIDKYYSTTYPVTDFIVAGNKDISEASMAVYLDGGSYKSEGSITLGNQDGDSGGKVAIGVYGENLKAPTDSKFTYSLEQKGERMSVGAGGLGIYGAGVIPAVGEESASMNVDIKDITLEDGAIGVYALNMETTIQGDVTVGSEKAIGIVSQNNGKVDYTGAMTIADKKTLPSIGLYKGNGTGEINTSADLWTVGKGSYGIYLTQDAGAQAHVKNRASMDLADGAVGIYSKGGNYIENFGDIQVGTTENGLNSVGIYAIAGGNVENTGHITVSSKGSVGIYGTGKATKIVNAETGKITVSGGGVGISVKDGAHALNRGEIELMGSVARAETSESIGMGAYTGATIENTGTITIDTNGVGMYVERGANLINTGTLIIKKGIGIAGLGTVVNTGKMQVTPGATEEELSYTPSSTIGSVTISSDGTVTINDQYISIGGTFVTTGDLIVNGAYVDVTTGTPVFNAQTISGDIKILPNFALTGNGISYEIKNFIETAIDSLTGKEDFTPDASPLFMTKVTEDGSLIIVKRPYADITVGDQFDALHKGLDNILENSGGEGKDADILKGLNAYLAGLSDSEFEDTAAQMLAETRGDIYATIQQRMQDINRTFDSSFYELEYSPNKAWSNDKYSVIYRNGDYRDRTVGIDDYDYNIAGLLYMKEYDERNLGRRYGYTLGITGAKFDFKDGGSEENVYSLRAGAHLYRMLNDAHRVDWITRIDLGYNRHNADRKLNLHQNYEDHGDFNSFSGAWDNRISKNILRDSRTKLDIYGDMNLEYGRFQGFKEHSGSDGGLELQLKADDYFSAKAGIGVRGSQVLGSWKGINFKLLGELKYDYDMGDNYSGNHARLVNGEEGYYSLITPEKTKGELIAKAGFTLEKPDHYGTTFEVEARDEGGRRDTTMIYSLRFNYKI